MLNPSLLGEKKKKKKVHMFFHSIHIMQAVIQKASLTNVLFCRGFWDH